MKPCWTVLIALFYGVVITKPDKSPVETVKSCLLYTSRTDLALEATERFTEENVEVRGVEVHEDYNEERCV